jgi:hypothetical protein
MEQTSNCALVSTGCTGLQHNADSSLGAHETDAIHLRTNTWQVRGARASHLGLQMPMSYGQLHKSRHVMTRHGLTCRRDALRLQDTRNCSYDMRGRSWLQLWTPVLWLVHLCSPWRNCKGLLQCSGHYNMAPDDAIPPARIEATISVYVPITLHGLR